VQLTRKRIGGSGFRGLLSTRQGALALALLCALAATVILIFALGRYRQSLSATTKQDTVLVATSLIQKGASGDVIAGQQQFKATPVLASQVSAGAISDSSFVHGKVAASDILPGQQLTAAEFTAAGGIGTQLAPAQRAMSLSLDAAHGLTNVVQTGDHVDIYGAFDVQNTPAVGLLVPDALVLQAPGGSGAPAGGNIVLAVSDSQAPQVAYAADNAKLWLVLRPGNAANPAAGLTTLDSILFGQHPNLSPSANLATNATGAHP
jgi:Flp pilus assembly protein CpaB